MLITVVPAITALAHQSIIHQFIQLKKNKRERDEEQAVNNGALSLIIFSLKNKMPIHKHRHILH